VGEHKTELPTGKDVARLAGVSVTTVSRVLNNRPHVRPEIRDRVLKTVVGLGYHPSRTARRLRARRSNVLGVLIPDIQNPFFTAIVRAIEDVAYQHDYSVVLCNSDESPTKERLYIDMMCAEEVAGIILATTESTGDHLDQLASRAIPVVAIDRQIGGHDVDTVLVSNVKAACEAVSHLIALGHRRIGFISLPLTLTVGAERHAGYVHAFKQNSLPVRPEYIRIGDTRQSSGAACTRDLLSISPPMTALFVANNLMTLGALDAIYAHGIAVPSQLSVIGFDEFPLMAYLQPPLTTVTQPTYEMGQRAAALLLARIDKPNRPAERTCLETTLLMRASTGVPCA
jgi:DNA-binding LacI/PurR family transcriptional regulator